MAGSQMSNKKLCLEEIESRLSPVLEQHGFDPKPSVLKANDVHFTDWIRDLGWRRDSIRVCNLLRSENISLGIEVGLAIEPDGPINLDGRVVQHLVNRTGYYRAPAGKGGGRWTRWRIQSVAKRVVRDCDKALSWFDQFATPTLALERLRTGETNGCGSGGKRYSEAERYLESLVARGKTTTEDS